MFSYDPELFLKAEECILDGLEVLYKDESVLTIAMENSGVFQSQVEDVASTIKSVTNQIKDLSVTVEKAKTNMEGLSNTGEFQSSFGGVTFSDSVGDVTTAVFEEPDCEAFSPQMEALLKLTPEQYFLAIEQSDLSEEDKQLAKDLYLQGNERASMAIFIRKMLYDDIDVKTEELNAIENRKIPALTIIQDGKEVVISEEVMQSHYEAYKKGELIDPNDPVYQAIVEFDTEKENDRIKKQQEIDKTREVLYQVNVAIDVWSFDYVEKYVGTEEYINYVNTSDEDVNKIVIHLEDKYKQNGNVTEEDYLLACTALGIDPNNVNRIKLFSEMQDSEVMGEYFDGPLTEDFFQNKWITVTEINTKGSLEDRAMIYLSDDDKEIYNYLYYAEGPERAHEFLLAKEDGINQQQGVVIAMQTIEEIGNGGSASKVWNAYWSGGESGLKNYFNDSASALNGNNTKTSQNYADIIIMQMITTQGLFRPVSKEELQKRVENGEISQESYDILVTKDGEVLEADVLYVNGDISDSEYCGYKEISESEAYQEFCESTSNGVGQASLIAYQTGSSTLYMIPSVSVSTIFGLAGAPTAARIAASLAMGIPSFGRARKDAVNSGASDIAATGLAILTVATELFTEYFLGAIPGFSQGSEFIDDLVDPVVSRNFWQRAGQVVLNVAANGVSEIPQEMIEDLLIRGYTSAVTGVPMDLTGYEGEALNTAIVTFFTTFGVGGFTGSINATSNVFNYTSNNVLYEAQVAEDGTVTIVEVSQIDAETNHSLQTSEEPVVEEILVVDSEIEQANQDIEVLSEEIAQIDNSPLMNKFENAGGMIKTSIENATSMINNIKNNISPSNPEVSIEELVVESENSTTEKNTTRQRRFTTIYSDDSVVVNQNQVQKMIGILDSKYGIGESINILNKTIETGDIDALPYDAMLIVDKVGIPTIKEYMGQVETDINTIVETMDSKYGQGEGVKALQNLVETGDYNFITRTNDARQLAHDINSLAMIESYVNYINSHSKTTTGSQVNSEVTVEPVVEEILMVDSEIEQANQDVEVLSEEIEKIDNSSLMNKFENVGETIKTSIENATSMINDIKNNISSSNSETTTVDFSNPSTYRSFSDVKNIAYKELSSYFGAASSLVHQMINDGKNVDQILAELDGEELVNAQHYFTNTRQGRYLTALSEEQIDAIQLWSSSNFDIINGRVRKGRLEGKVFGKDIKKVVNDLDTALNQYYLDEPIKLYRGTGLSTFTKNEQYGKLFEGLDINNLDNVYAVLKGLEGKKLSDKGYLGTSPTSSGAFTYKPLMFEILATEGTKGAYINEISNGYNIEYEFLLARDTDLKIVSVSLPEVNPQNPLGSKVIVVKCITV